MQRLKKACIYEKSNVQRTQNFQTFRNYLLPQPRPSNLQFLATPLACIPTLKLALAITQLKIEQKGQVVYILVSHINHVIFIF